MRDATGPRHLTPCGYKTLMRFATPLALKMFTVAALFKELTRSNNAATAPASFRGPWIH